MSEKLTKDDLLELLGHMRTLYIGFNPRKKAKYQRAYDQLKEIVEEHFRLKAMQETEHLVKDPYPLQQKPRVTRERYCLDENDWGMLIRCVRDGYIVSYVEEDTIIESPFRKEIDGNQDLLWCVIEYFAMNSSRYDRERIAVHVEVGDKYEPRKGEKIRRGRYIYIEEEK